MERIKQSTINKNGRLAAQKSNDVLEFSEGDGLYNVKEPTIKKMIPIRPTPIGIICEIRERFAWCLISVSEEMKYTIIGNKNGANKTLK